MVYFTINYWICICFPCDDIMMEKACPEQKETQETIITVPTVSIARGVTLNQVSEEQSGKEISKRLGSMNEEMWRAIFICEIMIILTFLALIDLSFIR